MAKNTKQQQSVQQQRSYQMSEYEKQMQGYIQNSLMNNVPNVNVFSPEVQNQMQQQLGAYANQGLKLLDQTYTPMFNNMKNDIARRFGNFDNSSFMNSLNALESKRADSMSDFAQDILAKQSQLYNEELARRYNYINLLTGMQGQIDNKILAHLGLPTNITTTTSSNSGINYGNFMPLLDPLVDVGKIFFPK